MHVCTERRRWKLGACGSRSAKTKAAKHKSERRRETNARRRKEKKARGLGEVALLQDPTEGAKARLGFCRSRLVGELEKSEHVRKRISAAKLKRVASQEETKKKVRVGDPSAASAHDRKLSALFLLISP